MNNATMAPEIQMTTRQQAREMHAEFEEMCKAFAASKGLMMSGSPKVTYYPGDALRITFNKVEFSEREEGVAETGLAAHVAFTVVTGIILNDALAYPKGARDVLEAAAMAGKLFKFGEGTFGPITGWNNRARTSPLQFSAVSKHGVPCAPSPYKTRSMRSDSIGIAADASDVLDVQIGDACMIDYIASDENDPEDVSGFYAGRIVALDKGMATVTYDSNPEAGTDDVPFSRLIVHPRFI